MSAIEGLWGMVRRLREWRRAVVRARRERAALEAEAINRMLEPILLRVREGIEADIDHESSTSSFDRSRAEALFGQAMARFHKRRRGLSGMARALKTMTEGAHL